MILLEILFQRPIRLLSTPHFTAGTHTTDAQRAELLKRSYVPALDGLRAFAVLAVLAFHLEDLLSATPALRWLALRGWYGVDVFFTLSGFLITWLMLREREVHGRIAVGRFYVRRVLRLWPAYLLVIFATTGVLWYAGTAEQRTQGIAALPFLLSYTSNFAAAAGVLFPLTLHSWSLAVEEQYYLVYPILVRSLTTERLAAVLVGLVVAIATCRAIGFFWWPFSWPSGGHLTTVVYYLTPLRVDSILIGALAATTLHLPRVLSWIESRLLDGWRTWALWLLWVPLAATFALESEPWLYIAWLPVLYTLCALVLLATFLGKPAPICRVFEWRPLVWIGRVSYGIYLLHVIVISVVSRAVESLGLPPLSSLSLIVLGSIGGTLVLAQVMHRFVEIPFLSLKRRFG